jgi:hypothetical protein
MPSPSIRRNSLSSVPRRGYRFIMRRLQGLDKARGVRGIAQHLSDFSDRLIQTGVEVDERVGRPDSLPEFLAARIRTQLCAYQACMLF